MLRNSKPAYQLMAVAALSAILAVADLVIGPLVVMPLRMQPLILEPFLWFALGLASLALASVVAVLLWRDRKFSTRTVRLCVVLIAGHLVLAALNMYWGWFLGVALSI